MRRVRPTGTERSVWMEVGVVEMLAQLPASSPAVAAGRRNEWTVALSSSVTLLEEGCPS